jgi:hypothetical protein
VARPPLSPSQHRAAQVFVARLATLATETRGFESADIGVRWLANVTSEPVAETEDGIKLSGADFALAGLEIAWHLLELCKEPEDREDFVKMLGLWLAQQDPALDGAHGEA